MAEQTNIGRRWRAHSGNIVEPIAWVIAVLLVACSAIVVKERGSAPPMVRVESHDTGRSARVAPLYHNGAAWFANDEITEDEAVSPALQSGASYADEIRWFDGRPVRPARTIWMTVTAYSPDEASCGPYADGRTATLHSVKTNAMQLVAADPRVLPYGSMLTIPGYAEGEIVPVLDCGGAIKGNRLDVLYPTHTRAKRWGVQRLAVTVWEYADGLPAPNPRTTR